MGKNYKRKAADNGKSNKSYDKKKGHQNYDKDDRTSARVRGSTDNYSTDSCYSNDPSWWNKKKDIFDNVTRIPFNRLTGLPSTVEGVDVENPPIMTVSYVPCIGKARDFTSPVNKAFQAIYTYMYSKNSGTVQFTQMDLAMFCIAMQSVAQNIAMVKRALRTAKIYATENQAYPRAIINAMGFDDESLFSEQANLRARLNSIIYSFNALPVLNIFDVYTRQFMLCNSVFMDNNGNKSQTYVFRPDVTYFYSDVGLQTGTDPDSGEPIYDGVAACIATPYPWTYNKTYRSSVDTILDMIDKQLDLLRSSSNFGLLAGAIIKAFDGARYLRITPVLETDVQVITYDDPYVSYQIHNMNYAGTLTDVLADERVQYNISTESQRYLIPRMNVTADVVSNVLKQTPCLAAADYPGGQMAWSGPFRRNTILNFFENNIDANMIMESTRLASLWDGDDVGFLNAVTCSTEYVSGLQIYVPYKDLDLSVRYDVLDVPPALVYSENTPDLVTSSSRIQCVLERFHKAPRLVVTYEDFDSAYVTGDLHNWTSIGVTELEGLNEAGMWSIYDVPETYL